MTVFEDLIVELKEENLLEDTVITVGIPSKPMFASGQDEDDFADLIDSDSSYDELPHETGSAIVGADAAAPKARENSAVHKFAIEQVATFQIVEHVITSIERDRLNLNTRGFDELDIKKAIHKFQQASADPSTLAFAEAEAELVHEVGIWQENLAARDSDIAVSMMRQHCETCQPALSAQALFSLARFYRSLPYSESARGKFEFLVTRLFSRKGEGETRTVICSKEEMLSHLCSRFRDASDSYSDIPGDDADVMLAVLSFDDFNAEAEGVESFDNLIDVNFFARLFQFKESAGKCFFAPTVAAAAISSNLAIANKLAALVSPEHLANKGTHLLEKYASLYDESISNAVGRTLTLRSLLAEVPAQELEEEDEKNNDSVEKRDETLHDNIIDLKREAPIKYASKAPGKPSAMSFAGVNRWLMAATIVVAVLSSSLYIWANYYADPPAISQGVTTVDLSATPYKDLVKEARLSGETFYGITGPTWDGMTKESQQEALTNMLKLGSEKGFKRISLINVKGQTVGFATDGKINVFKL
ncbi:MAG: hypothetical protein ABI999_17965 [Acidobacteriota bacterium]